MHIYIALVLLIKLSSQSFLRYEPRTDFHYFTWGGGFPVITCSIGGASRRLSRSDFANTNQELT